MASTNLLLLVAATAAVLLLAGSAEARLKGISPFCRTAKNHQLCTKMVKGATTQDAAILNAAQATIKLTAHIMPTLRRMVAGLPKSSPSLPKEMMELWEPPAVQTCADHYDKVMNNLGDVKSCLDLKERHTAILWIRSAEDWIKECADAIKERETKEPERTTMSKYNGILSTYAGTCMAVATQK